MVAVDVEADNEAPESDGTTGALSVPLVLDTKGGGGLAVAVGNVACSQETCSGVNGGGVELILATATNRHNLEGRARVLKQQTAEQQVFTSCSK